MQPEALCYKAFSESLSGPWDLHLCLEQAGLRVLDGLPILAAWASGSESLGREWTWKGREGELGQRPIQATPSPQPENILCVNTTGHLVKIIDFGLARRYRLGGWGGQGKPLRRAGGKARVEVPVNGL